MSFLFYVIRLDISKFGRRFALLSSNRRCFALVCRPLRLKSSASSATVTSSSFTVPLSRLPTMESLPVRGFCCFIRLTLSCCLMAASCQKWRRVNQFAPFAVCFSSEWSWGFYGKVNVRGFGKESIVLACRRGGIKHLYRSTGPPNASAHWLWVDRWRF